MLGVMSSSCCSEGTFAKVYHARNVGTREEVAIKIIYKDYMSKLGAVQQQVMHKIDIRR
jgi:serine/threonine protein kinase